MEYKPGVSVKFYKGLFFGILISVAIFWGPLIWWLTR